MKLAFWTAKRLSLWVLGSVALFTLLVVWVEGVEQARAIREQGLSLLVRRALLLLRDVLPLAFVLGAGAWALRLRERELPALQLLGRSPVAVLPSAAVVLLLMNGGIGVLLEKGIDAQAPGPQEGLVLQGQGTLVLEQSPEKEKWIAQRLVWREGAFVLEEVAASQQQIQEWAALSSLPNATRQALQGSERPGAEAWRIWRTGGLWLPALLAWMALTLGLCSSLGGAWLLGGAMGFGLALQWAAHLVLRNGWLVS